MIHESSAEKARKRKDRRQREEDHAKAARCLVPNDAARAARLLILPVYTNDPAYARKVLAEGAGEIRISAYIEPYERSEIIEILTKYGIPYEDVGLE